MWLLFRIRWAKLEKHVVWFAGCFEPFPWTKLSKDWHALSSWSILFCWELFFPDFNCNVLGRSLLNTGVNKSELRPYSASDIFSFIIIYIPCLFPGKLPDKSGKHLFCTESLCIRLAFYFKTYNETEDVFCFLNWISCAWTFINPFLKGLKTRNTGVLTRNTSVCSVFFLPKMLLTYDPKMVSGGAGFRWPLTRRSWKKPFGSSTKMDLAKLIFRNICILVEGKTISCCGDFWKWEMIQTFSDTMYVFSDIPLALSWAILGMFACIIW